MIIETIVNFLAAVVVMLTMAALLAFPVMWLWNWLVPTIFGLTELTFFPAMGLFLLCDILFKGGVSANASASYGKE